MAGNVDGGLFREKLVWWSCASGELLKLASFTEEDAREAIGYLVDFPEEANGATSAMEFARAAGEWWISVYSGYACEAEHGHAENTPKELGLDRLAAIDGLRTLIAKRSEGLKATGLVPKEVA